MDYEQFISLIPFIVCDLVNMIVQKQNLSESDAITMLYNSKLYSLLEKEDTKVWYYSTDMLYSLLLQEQRTGSIVFPDV